MLKRLKIRRLQFCSFHFFFSQGGYMLDLILSYIMAKPSWSLKQGVEHLLTWIAHKVLITTLQGDAIIIFTSPRYKLRLKKDKPLAKHPETKNHQGLALTSLSIL